MFYFPKYFTFSLFLEHTVIKCTTTYTQKSWAFILTNDVTLLFDQKNSSSMYSIYTILYIFFFFFTEPSVPQKYVRTETVMGRKIFEFKSYRDGQLFRFDVPLDTRIATWRFLSNFTRGCIPGTVSV